LREIWGGFQQILADNNEVMGFIGNLEEMLVSQKDLDLPYLNSRIWLLDQHIASLVAVLQKISGAKYRELESAGSGSKRLSLSAWKMQCPSPPAR